MQLDAVFASEIMWTDVLNVRRWKHRSKMIEIRIEAKIAVVGFELGGFESEWAKKGYRGVARLCHKFCESG